MTTEELVKALRKSADNLENGPYVSLKTAREEYRSAASAIERQAEAIRVLREALHNIDNLSNDLFAKLTADKALAQTKEFGE